MLDSFLNACILWPFFAFRYVITLFLLFVFAPYCFWLLSYYFFPIFGALTILSFTHRHLTLICLDLVLFVFVLCTAIWTLDSEVNVCLKIWGLFVPYFMGWGWGRVTLCSPSRPQIHRDLVLGLKFWVLFRIHKRTSVRVACGCESTSMDSGDISWVLSKSSWCS